MIKFNELKSFEYDKKQKLSSKEFTGHDCVVYIKNPDKDKDEAFIGGYDCSPDFGKYGNTNKRNTSNNTVPVLIIKNKVTIKNNNFNNPVYPVTSIYFAAFRLCESLNTITFEKPSSITSIGENAFYSSSLASIEIPNSVTSIGISAFAECEKLSEITFEKGITLQSIGEYAFKGSGLASIEIPKSVTSIGEYAFENSGLTSIVIPKSVTIIGIGAFFDCKNLSNITFEEGSTLQSIGHYAFNGSGLVSIEIPKSVTSIGQNAFNISLIEIIFKKKSKLESISSYLFENCIELSSIEIPNSVTSIGESAFSFCNNLNTITFEKLSSITSIGKNAFFNTGITSIEIPNSVTSIEEGAFEKCENLISITFEEGIVIPILEQKNIIKKYIQTTTTSVEGLEKSENIKKKENDDKIIYHPILSNDNLLSKWKEHRPELFRGYNDMCELMHGYKKKDYYVLDSDSEQKTSAPVLNLNNGDNTQKPIEEIYIDLINYIKTKKNSVPQIIKDIGSDVGGLSRDFCTMIGNYIKLTFMTDLIPNNLKQDNQEIHTNSVGGGNLEPLAQVTSINNTTHCIKDINEGKYKKMFDINKLNEENIKTLSLVLYFFMYTMSPFCRKDKKNYSGISLYLNLGISFSDFTLMIIFGMFKKIGENKLLSEIVEEIINYISNVENNIEKDYFVEPVVESGVEAEEKTKCEVAIGDKSYYPSNENNNPEKRTPFQSVLDNKLEYYIGVMNSLDESVFEEEIREDINNIKIIGDEKNKTYCLSFPLQSFIIKLIYNLYSFDDRKQIILKIEDYNQTYVDILGKILGKLKLLESINTNLKDILNCTSNSTTCFTENDEPLSLYDLSKLISSPLIVTKESVINLLENTKENKENNTQDMKDAIDALKYTLNSVEMNNNIKFKQFLRFITGSTNLPNKILITLVENKNIDSHTCFNQLDIIKKVSFINLQEKEVFAYKNKKYEDFIKDKLLEAIQYEGFGFSGGGRNRNRISNKKISKKYKKKYSKINIINNKNNKYSKNMKYKLLNISKSKKCKKV